MEEILPTVGTPFAREQVFLAALLCDHMAVRWDRAHLFVTAELEDLRATLGAALDRGRRCPAPGADLTGALDATEAALGAAPGAGAQPLRELEAANAELKRSVVRLLEACAGGSAADPGTRAEMQETLRGYMRRQLEREAEWVSTTVVGWW